jgi:hypothetical protein
MQSPPKWLIGVWIIMIMICLMALTFGGNYSTSSEVKIVDKIGNYCRDFVEQVGTTGAYIPVIGYTLYTIFLKDE